MSESKSEEKKPRKRSLTEITLTWLAERVRRAEKIKEEVNKGTYTVDSQKIASAILNDKS